MSYDSYGELFDVTELPESLLKKIEKDDNLPLVVRVLGYDDKQLSPTPLSELLDSAAYEEFEQFQVALPRAINFLTEKGNGFIHTHKMLKPILFANYIGGEPVIVGGRHRTTGLGLLYAAKGIPAENVTIYVQRLEVDSLEDLLKLVQADNGSRNMTSAEKLSCYAQTLGYDIQDPAQVVESLSAPASERLTLGQVAKLVFPTIYDGELELKPETLGSIGTSFAATVNRTSGKNIKKYKLYTPEFISNLLATGAELLKDVLNDETDISNVARNATHIGRKIAERFEAELNSALKAAKAEFEAEANRVAAEKAAKAEAKALKAAEKAEKETAKAEKEAAKAAAEAEVVAEAPKAKKRTAKPKATV